MRSTFKIRNRTHWNTQDLRRFLVRVANESFDDGEKPVIHVEATYNRGGMRHSSCSGRAVLGGHWLRIMLPSGSVDRIDLAHVIAHEFAHLRGLNHSAMRGAALWGRVGNYREIYAWAEELQLRKKERRMAPRLVGVALAEVRRGVIEAKLKRWVSKRKRAETAIRKLQRQLHYYDRRLAALGPDREKPGTGAA